MCDRNVIDRARWARAHNDTCQYVAVVHRCVGDFRLVWSADEQIWRLGCDAVIATFPAHVITKEFPRVLP